MKMILVCVFLTFVSSNIYSQDIRSDTGIVVNSNYAYVSISGKLFSKKLKVIVDLGDSPEQIQVGEEYSDLLTNRRSYAAILNFMVDKGYELVQTLTLNESSSYQGNGSGGTSGIIFIMKKRIKTAG